MNVRVRGIYATAITERIRGAHDVVSASEPIRDRFDEPFPPAPFDATVEDTGDRQGVGVVGAAGVVADLRERIQVGRDTLSWADPTPKGAVYDGRVTETLGSGAVVDLGDGSGFLPYGNADRVDDSDGVRVQVAEPRPPWSGDRAVLDTRIRVDGGLVTLTRGASFASEMAWEDLLPPAVPDGWGVRWDGAAEDADMDALETALGDAVERAERIEAALADAPAPEASAPAELVAGRETAWLWFGRESRFALDDLRRDVTATMPGHHRIKAGGGHASAAVDFAEAVCDPGDGAFPFGVVSRQFGPTEGDRLALGHGKPDGRYIVLGEGEVTAHDPEGAVTVEREMTPGGTYDALGVERQAGDVAVTKLREGRWWYPTVYRGEDGTSRGTYVNVCTPVELFPETARYVDLHVDVVRHADGTVERVDDDDLDAAVAAGHVPEPLAEKAREVASRLENAL
jgi:hypothetical protein